jgi:predicted nucleic acid-binding Zn ribbon protein
VGEALGRLTKSLGIAKAVDEYTIVAAWPEIVGERIAGVTTAQRIENGVLVVSVATAPWRMELSLQRHEIIRKINAETGKDIVKDIRFR